MLASRLKEKDSGEIRVGGILLPDQRLPETAVNQTLTYGQKTVIMPTRPNSSGDRILARIRPTINCVNLGGHAVGKTPENPGDSLFL